MMSEKDYTERAKAVYRFRFLSSKSVRKTVHGGLQTGDANAGNTKGGFYEKNANKRKKAAFADARICNGNFDGSTVSCIACIRCQAALCGL